MSGDQISVPRKTEMIKFPSPGQEKASNARGTPGGMLKLRFDWYISFTNTPDLSVRIIFLWKRNAPWEVINKTHEKFVDFGCGE